MNPRTFGTDIKVVEGGETFLVKPMRPPVTEHPADEIGFIEDVIRNTSVRHGKISTRHIELASIIGSTGLEEFLAAFKGADLPSSLDVEVISTHGRVVMVRNKCGAFPPWLHLAQVLIGLRNPCDDYRVQGDKLIAILKTAAQRDAESAAGALDELFNAQVGRCPDPRHTMTAEGIYRASVDAAYGEKTDTPEHVVNTSKRKKKIPGGAATVVMETIKTLSPSGAVDIEKLVEEAVKHMPKRKDARGQDRRKDYAERAIGKLVEMGHLHVHGDDQTQVSLTALVVKDE